MQVKVMIGMGAMMVAMLLLGYVALTETGRMKTFAARANGRAIEQGAVIYEMYCTECHGIYGKAEECFDTYDNLIKCQGLPLNDYYLFCEDRKEEKGFAGTNAQFIEQTIARLGRARNQA